MPGDLVAIELRKTNVDQGDLRLGVKNKVEASSPIRGHLDVMTVKSQKYLEHLTRIGVILDHNDSAWRRRSSFQHLYDFLIRALGSMPPGNCAPQDRQK